jgi:ABC-type Fe3+ transport system substrate-binding protein
MFRGKWKFLLGIIVLLMIVSAVYVFYLYQQGGTENYNPPVQKTDDPKVQILSYMTVLSLAVEAYYAKNLRYPDKLEQLKPEFIDKIPLETGTGKSFIYESDGIDRYRITVSDPSRYGFKELFTENGKIIQK